MFSALVFFSSVICLAVEESMQAKESNAGTEELMDLFNEDYRFTIFEKIKMENDGEAVNIWNKFPIERTSVPN
jgi:hypothetical protein